MRYILFRSRLLATLVFLTAIATGTAAAQYDGELHWVTTWSMSPSTLPVGSGPEASMEDAFTNRTLRQIIHTSAGGDSVRVRLSNTHGSKPLRIGAVSIALQDEGSSIVAGSVRTLTFSQLDSFTIPRGAVAVSDPLPFEVPALSNLSISIYLPEGSGRATTHRLAQQTAYVSSAGDFSSAAQFDEEEQLSVLHFISAVDTGRADEITTIVAVGDSITDGFGSTMDANRRWPNYLARRLLDDDQTPEYAVANAGISGNRVLHENNPAFGENLQARFERDVLALSNVSHIILLQGINDIGMATMFPDQQVTAEEIIAGYRQVIARARARGIQIFGATLTPYQGAGYYREEGDVRRQQVNEWIRNSGEFDAVIDFEQATWDPDNPLQLLPEFTTDYLHPNDAGYEAMAQIIDLTLFR